MSTQTPNQVENDIDITNFGKILHTLWGFLLAVQPFIVPIPIEDISQKQNEA
jgi:hypothetical protein